MKVIYGYAFIVNHLSAGDVYIYIYIYVLTHVSSVAKDVDTSLSVFTQWRLCFQKSLCSGGGHMSFLCVPVWR